MQLEKFPGLNSLFGKNISLDFFAYKRINLRFLPRDYYLGSFNKIVRNRP